MSIGVTFEGAETLRAHQRGENGVRLLAVLAILSLGVLLISPDGLAISILDCGFIGGERPLVVLDLGLVTKSASGHLNGMGCYLHHRW